MFSVTQAHGFPATLYLSTYYVEDQRPVFNVALDYLFWKYGGLYQVLPSSCLYARAGDEKVTAERIKEIVSDLGTELESIVIRELCQYFGESYEEWLARGKLMFLSESDVKKLGQQGVNLELHTHRHRFAGIENGGAEREVNENLAAIHRICGGRPRHFCYPSGEYHHEQVRLLKDAGVSTATTTRNELVSLSDPLLELPRIMDSEHVSEVEFEAELSGFMSLLRQIRPSRSGAGRAPVPSVER
ncbi:polysaccharide deacetylase [Chromatocurvus halotolerans]|uniref:Polysaccharide deacetylase n=2 Tax=Chromatocurvus halotolerans TaxID=1132028 RepID=A0A4R2KNZ3_9GAMM|nr:polysaccharide deacetylase [Chromatocurvus halotolerans]